MSTKVETSVDGSPFTETGIEEVFDDVDESSESPPPALVNTTPPPVPTPPALISVVTTPEKAFIEKLPLRKVWEKVRKRYARRLVEEGRKPSGLARYVKGARVFIDWAVDQGLTPGTITLDLKDSFAKHIGDSEAAPISKNIHRLAGHSMIEEAVTMTNEPEELDEEAPEENEEEPIEPAKRKAIPQQVVFVAQKPPRAKPVYERAQPRSPAAKILPRVDKIRVFKRAGGRKLFINDYTTDDIGGSLHKFIKDFVDPEFGDSSGITDYEVYEVDARDDREKGPGSRVTIDSGTQQQPLDDDLKQARGAVELIRELRDLDEEKRAKSTELLSEAQKRAVQGGDMNSLMMLMMMQQMFQPRNEMDIASKVLEHVRGRGAPTHLGDLAAALPLVPPPLPPVVVPPHPPPENKLADVAAEVLKLQLQPKPEKSAMDFAKELAAIRELFAPPPADPEMKLILRQLMERSTQSGGGIDGAISTFGKIKEMVTTLAPQVNAGGIVGTLQSILTPELGKAIGNMLAGGIAKAQADAKPTPSPAETPVAPAPNAATKVAVGAFREAQGEQLQLQRALELLQALYQDPGYAGQLEPALQALLRADSKPAHALALKLLKEIRPDLATAEFANKVVAALIVNAGGTPPAELTAAPPPVLTPAPTAVDTAAPTAVDTAAPTAVEVPTLVPTAVDTAVVETAVEVVTYGKPTNSSPPSAAPTSPVAEVEPASAMS